MAPRSRVPGAVESRREVHGGYSTSRVKTVLELIGLTIFVVCVIALAAAATAAVVRISPTRDKPEQPS
jgi:Mn2+/Fe2+ NRAMP family transporter